MKYEKFIEEAGLNLEDFREVFAFAEHIRDEESLPTVDGKLDIIGMEKVSLLLL
jgi:hypothetical protein